MNFEFTKKSSQNNFLFQPLLWVRNSVHWEDGFYHAERFPCDRRQSLDAHLDDGGGQRETCQAEPSHAQRRQRGRQCQPRVGARSHQGTRHT